MEKKFYIKLWSRHYTVQYCEVAMLCYENTKMPWAIKNSYFIPEQGNESYCVAKTDWEKLDEKLNKILHSKTLVKKVFYNLHFLGKKYAGFGKNYTPNKLNKFSNLKIAQIYKQYFRLAVDYCSFLAMILVLNNQAADECAKTLKNLKITDSEITNSLFSPSKKVGVLELQNKLEKIKNKNSTLSDRQIKHLLKEFAWISCLDLHNNPWTKTDLISFFKELKPSIKTLNFKKAFKKAGLKKQDLDFFMLAKELAYLKDMRDVYRRKGVYNSIPFFDEIAKRLKITRKILGYYTSNEILSALNNRPIITNEAITKRINGFALFKKENLIKATTKPAIIKKLKNKIVANGSKKNFLSGIPASIGLTTGRVKIVLNIKDIKKIKKGNILVAVTTHPDFVPAMQKAAAIITDEGGLTSHAAIVSRELHKPCIVGTKFATKVFRDGDMVEVDANKGIVRKI